MIDGSAAGEAERYAALRAALDRAVPAPPLLDPEGVGYETISLEDLVAAGAVSVFEAPPTVEVHPGGVPMLGSKDIRLGRAASKYADPGAVGVVVVAAGDVAVVMGAQPAVRVCTVGGDLLGPGIALVRGNTGAVDPDFLAGVLRAALMATPATPIDLYRVAIPRIALAGQRRLGVAFRRLEELESDWQRRRSEIDAVVRAGVGGLATGRLRPAALGE